MRRHALGLTMIELLTVVAIIAILVGILIPATQAARRAAQNAKQKAQLTAIDVALTTFREDYGDYPPSDMSISPGPLYYCGAQKLAEALVGRDMGGFDPNSRWSVDDGAYRSSANRKGFYLDPGTGHPFRVGNRSPQVPGLYPLVLPLAPDTFVLCDVYPRTRVEVLEGAAIRDVRMGSPILYYRARSDPLRKMSSQIYTCEDNMDLIGAKERFEQRKDAGPWRLDPPNTLAQVRQSFYEFIRDPRVPLGVAADAGSGLPYRPDSYILVSAGLDGIYGTTDDMCNFSRVGGP